MVQFIESSNATYAYKMIWRKTAADLGAKFYIITKCKSVKLQGVNESYSYFVRFNEG